MFFIRTARPLYGALAISLMTAVPALGGLFADGLMQVPHALAEPTELIPFDTDEDGDVDWQDFAVLNVCLSGPGIAHDGTGVCW